MTSERSHYLVFGATGQQGGAIARALVTRGEQVRGFARKEVTGSPVPLVTGDLGDPEAVQRAFHGITHAAVTLPLVYDPKQVAAYARAIAQAAQANGVRQLVYNTNTVLPSAVTSYPAFETRREAEAILRDSGVPLVVLRPPVYLENLFNPGVGVALMNQGILAYPLPQDRRVSWLAHADLAAAVIAALDDPELSGSTIDIGGETVTGPELAAVFSQILDQDIRYVALDVDVFGQGLGQAVGAAAAAGVSGLYRFANTDAGRDLFDVDPTVLPRVFNVEPTPISIWVAAQPWQQWSAKA